MGDDHPPRVLAIVPAYNESESIAQVVLELRRCPVTLDVLVVDDGSTDGTADIARSAGAVVCSLPYNMGIGVTVQTGFVYAARHGYGAACQVDGDGQHIPDELSALLEPVLAGVADVVIGSRFLSVRSYRPPFLRRTGSVWLRGIINGIGGVRLTDVTSGFRAYGQPAIRFLAEHYPTQFPEPEAIVWLLRHGFFIAEVPVSMRERQQGRSSIGLLKAPWYMLRVTLGVLMTSIRCRVLWKEN